MIGYDDLHSLPASAFAVALGSTGDKVTFRVPYRCRVEMVAAVIEGASAHATAAIIKFDKRPTASSDTGRGDGDVGVVKKLASTAQTGKFIYQRPATAALAVVLKPGEEVIGEVTTAQGEALAASLFVLVRQTPEDPANEANMVATL